MKVGEGGNAMFCMNCGAQLPDGAKFCMNCGTQVGKASDVKNVLDEKSISDDSEVLCEETVQKQPKVEKEKYIQFELLRGNKVGYVEDTKYVAKYYGTFVDMMNEMVLDLQQQYKRAGDVKNAIQYAEKTFQKHADKAINIACEILTQNNIFDIGKLKFSKRYMQEYYQVYNENLMELVEVYNSVLQGRNELSEYREMQKASRGRWTGAGFGMKGAIKASVQASLLNAGSDLWHGIGDNIREASDDAAMNKKLKELYECNRTKSVLCDDPRFFVLGVYNELREILVERLELSSNIFRYDMEKAETIYTSTENCNAPSKKKKENYVQCIKLYPAEPAYYQPLIEDIVLQENVSEYERFLNFWGINKTFLYTMVDECQKEYSIQKTSVFKYNVSDKRASIDYSNLLNKFEEKVKKSELKDFFAFFTSLCKRNSSVANDQNNTRLYEKLMVQLHEKKEFLNQIVIFVCQNSYGNGKVEGIVIGADELVFIFLDEIIHIPYSKIESITFKNRLTIYLNSNQRLEIGMGRMVQEDREQIWLFIVLKILKRKSNGEKLPFYFNNK